MTQTREDLARQVAERWDELQAAVQAWNQANQPEDLPPVQTTSGIPIKPLYTPLDTAELDYLKTVGLPGDYPFTRGIHPLMYRTKVWTMRQYSGYPTAAESNRHYRNLYYQQGATGMSVAFHLPSQMGYDSDDPDIWPDVGGTGVAVDSVEDMKVLFDGIPLDKVSTSFTINATAAIILAMYIVAGEESGVRPDQLTGTLQNDVLKEYFARGAYIFPVDKSLRLVGDIVEYCTRSAPKFGTISVCGYHIRETGSNAVQEVAFSMLDAMAYIDLVRERGLDVDAFAARISWNMTAHMDLFEEVAKLRAARRLWAKIMRERYGAKNPRSWKYQLFAGGGGSTLHAKEPDNNIIRQTIECLALSLAGAQAMTMNTRDEALGGIPSAQAQLIALRTQQIIAYEAGVPNTIDPLAGSYYVETLTNQYQEAIEAAIADVESKGGMVWAIENGYVQRLILEEDYKFTQDVQSGKRPIIGVNKFVLDEGQVSAQPYRRDDAACQAQVEKVRRLKAGRDDAAVLERLQAVRATAGGNDNLLPPIIEAVRARATVGEITKAMVEVWGRFKEPGIF